MVQLLGAVDENGHALHLGTTRRRKSAQILPLDKNSLQHANLGDLCCRMELKGHLILSRLNIQP